MAYDDEIYPFERRTTGQLRLPGTHTRKPYKGHDGVHSEEKRHGATNPYQKEYTTTREDRRSFKPDRRIATGSPPHWQDQEQSTASSSNVPRTSKPRGPSGLRHHEYLGPDPGAFENHGKRRDEHRPRSNRNSAYSPPRHHSPARSHRSSGSRASRSSYHDGLTPMGIDMDLDYDSDKSYYQWSPREAQYDPNPPTPGRGFEENWDRMYGGTSRHRHYSPATSHYSCPSPRY